MKVLVVDDDLALLGLVSFALRQAGFLTCEVSDGAAVLAAFEREQPDLVILDVNLPGVSGFDLCRQIRAQSAAPIMMLTVRSSEEDEVHGLDLGADDYLTKPFSPRALLARVRALLRRGEAAGSEQPRTHQAGDLTLDVENQSVSVRQAPPVRLTNLEFRLFHYLFVNAPHTLPAERLTQHVWGFQGTGDRQLLKQLVHRLRQKIEADPSNPRFVLTAAGTGYMLNTSAGDERSEPAQ